MTTLITGAAGNIGSFLTPYLAARGFTLRLLVHVKAPKNCVVPNNNVALVRGDLAEPGTLRAACEGCDAVVHLAGVLFRPRPERFLPVTNTVWAKNIIDAALAGGVKKFVLISFPHVEGETTPACPATGRLDGGPSSVHARTRLAAERYLFAACEDRDMVPVSLRAGMIYGRGVLMIEAARWLARRRLLAVWPEPTYIHIISLPDFLACVAAALTNAAARGIYNLGDEQPLTLQEFLDTATARWRYRRPWRLPRWSFFAAAAAVETFASIFRTAAPLTRDFVKIGMASYVMDTTRTKAALLPHLAYPTLREGLELL